ncbi:MAG TPA: hypothetical protein VIV54_10485 [Burkholderiales bacterium]
MNLSRASAPLAAPREGKPAYLRISVTSVAILAGLVAWAYVNAYLS